MGAQEIGAAHSEKVLRPQVYSVGAYRIAAPSYSRAHEKEQSDTFFLVQEIRYLYIKP